MFIFKWIHARPARGAWITVIIVALLFLLNGRVLEQVGWKIPPTGLWLSTLALLLLAIAVMGASANGRPDGVLIDNRNRVSLSKFQMTLWTVLVLSAIFALAGWRATTDGPGNALEFKIPAYLLVAMGISAASFAGTPLILSAKTETPASPDATARTAEKLNLTATEMSGAGRVFGRAEPERASWADMFRGDEMSNAASADLSKVQQFLISVGLVATYGGMLWAMFDKAELPTGLPEMSDRFAWLMGISHATYLAYKAAPHGPSPDAVERGAAGNIAVG